MSTNPISLYFFVQALLYLGQFEFGLGNLGTVFFYFAMTIINEAITDQFRDTGKFLNFK